MPIPVGAVRAAATGERNADTRGGGSGRRYRWARFGPPLPVGAVPIPVGAIRSAATGRRNADTGGRNADTGGRGSGRRYR